MRFHGADLLYASNYSDKQLKEWARFAREFKKVTTLPVIIQSNAGKPELRENRVAYPETPEFFSEKIHELIDAGVSIIGGCCGTTPEHIRVVKNVVDSRQITN